MRHPFRARLSALLFTAALLAGFCVSYAAPAAQSVPVWRGSVYVDSAVAAILDEEDNMQELFSYNGTIYIPLRQAGAWMGKQVDWDQQGKTVLLSGRTTARVLAAEEATGNQQTPSERAEKEEREKNGIDIQICPDITVTMDGVEQRFHNVKGERVYPAVYDQRVYLPVRSIGTLMGMEVTYYSAPDRGDGCESPSPQGRRGAGRPGGLSGGGKTHPGGAGGRLSAGGGGAGQGPGQGRSPSGGGAGGSGNSPI